MELMIFGISIITTTGFPYYTKTYAVEPRKVLLKILFFDYSKKLLQRCDESQFELQAGLISAIFNFSKSLNNVIHELVYFKPEFQVENLLDAQESKQPEIGTLITVQCESYSFKEAVKGKLDYIYHKILEPLEPLSSKTKLAPEEETLIQEVLLNVPAKRLVRSRSKALEKYMRGFVKEHQPYGVKGAAILTYDFTPLKVVNYTTDELQNLLRSVAMIPDVAPLSWKYRQAWTPEGEPVSLIFVNSAFNVEFDTLKEPLMYILVCEENAIIGDIPRTLYLDLNRLLE